MTRHRLLFILAGMLSLSLVIQPCIAQEWYLPKRVQPVEDGRAYVGTRGSYVSNATSGFAQVQNRGIDLVPYYRKSLRPRLSVYADLPLSYRSTVSGGSTNSEAGIGDMSVQGSYVLESRTDEIYTASLDAILPTGDEDAGLGSGDFQLAPGVTVSSISDPLILSGFVGFNANFDNFSDNSALRYQLGTSMAMNPRVNLNVFTSGDIVGILSNTGQDFQRLSLGMDLDFYEESNLSVDLTLGLNDFTTDSILSFDWSTRFNGMSQQESGS